MLSRLQRVTPAGTGDTIPDEASDMNSTWRRKEEEGGREAQLMHISCSAQCCGILPAGNSTSLEMLCVLVLKVPRQTAGDGRLSSVVWWVVS